MKLLAVAVRGLVGVLEAASQFAGLGALLAATITLVAAWLARLRHRTANEAPTHPAPSDFRSTSG
jgi:hypothetical protein